MLKSPLLHAKRVDMQRQSMFLIKQTTQELGHFSCLFLHILVRPGTEYRTQYWDLAWWIDST